MTFREYYNIDLLQEVHGLDISMAEAIINPDKISIKKVDLDYLQNKFKDINFNIGDLGGTYDVNKDKIAITFNDKTTPEEIEAIIGHEVIHRIQHKKSNGKYLEQSKKLVQDINKMADKVNNSTDEKYMKKYNELLSKFLYSSVQEKMTYAYQLVKLRNDKEYNFKSPSDIVKYIKKFNSLSTTKYEIDKKFKKYIGMYWLIKDEI